MEDNPRLEGLSKRKWPVLEFENECKRIRPNFSPELELEFGSEGQPKEAGAETVEPSRKMFSIFFKPKDLKTKKSPPKVPKIKKKSTSIRKKSLTTNTSKPGGDIRKYFNRSDVQAATAVLKTVPAVSASDSCQQLYATNYTRAEVTQGVGGEIKCRSKSRARESEISWDPGL